MEGNVLSQRNYGIDLLRILSMYMVVILHVLGCGGILENCEKYSINYYVVWFLETASFCAVDVFAIISGYVMCEKKVNEFRIIPLWLTVFFYSSLITILFYFIPSLSELHAVTKKELLKGILFPTVSRQYWYFTSYFGLFFFIPYINIMLSCITQKQHKKLCFFIILIFSILPLLSLNRVDLFNVSNGYSTLWLVCLFIIGAYLKKYPIQFSPKKCILMYVICIFCAWFTKYLSHFFYNYLLNRDGDSNLFIDYTSVFILFSAIVLVILFSQLCIEKESVKKIICFVSPLAFSVYLIHTQRFIFDDFLKNLFINIIDNNPILLFFKVILYSLIIFISCIFIDIIRFFIFKFLGINKIPTKLYNKYAKE